MSILKSLITVIVFPSQTFEFLSTRSNWRDSIAPMIILALTGILTLVFLKDLITEIQFEQSISRIEESTRIPDDQKDEYILKVEERIMNPSRVMQIVSWSANALRMPVRVILMAVVIMIIGNTFFGGNAAYGSIVTMTGYAYLVNIPEMVVKIPLILSKWSMEVFTGLGLFGWGERGTFLYNYLAGIDLFGLWRIILLAIGMGVLYQKETKPFLVALMVFWILQVGVLAGLAAYLQ